MSNEPQLERTGQGLLIRAPGKINLSLLIAGKRPDGYHAIETLMAKISLFDEIHIEPGTTEGIELTCKGPHWAPEGGENLVYKAAELLLDATGHSSNVRITLTKNMPAGSGLGSASSDAAATLIGLNKFLGLTMRDAALADLAARLGSDVGFFIYGPLSMCTGRGEIVRPIIPSYEFTALLVLPEVMVSTKDVYSNYVHDPEVYQRLHRKIEHLLRSGQIDAIAKSGANMLARTCYSFSPHLADLREEIASLGIGPVCLSGSGSAMFCVIESREGKHARRFQRMVKERTGCDSIIVTNVPW